MLVFKRNSSDHYEQKQMDIKVDKIIYRNFMYMQAYSVWKTSSRGIRQKGVLRYHIGF